MVERARPLLGTYVAIRVDGLGDADAHHAIEDAFGEITLIHRCMTAHDAESDVGRLNREASRHPVDVHPFTYAVLKTSMEIAAQSDGAFDITVASELMKWGRLPSWGPLDGRGSWRDVELRPDRTVRFHRRVAIDLGGVAKGYAVDRAIERLRERGVAHACVNAGGDLGVIGPRTERIHLRAPLGRHGLVPVIDIENGSVASSGGSLARRGDHADFPAAHVDPERRRLVGARSFTCVTTDRCVIADALTKVVMVHRRRSEAILRHYGATAYLYTAGRGWTTFGAQD